jgi:tetratricopeptide (TPR) repeat protein
MSDTKTVTALRKQGKLDEALALARTLIAAQPNDPWVIRAYGWSLHDCVKQAERSKNRPRALELMVEFNKLQIPDDDELLLKRRGHYQITLLGSETHLAESLRRAREQLRDYPNDLGAIKDYGWILCDGVTHALNIKNPEIAEKLFNELALLSDRIPVSEEGLHWKIKRFRSLVQPDEIESLLLRAESARKEGQAEQAAELYEAALKKQPESVDANTGLAWEIRKQLKSLSNENTEDCKKALDATIAYIRIAKKNLDQPSLLHSLVLSEMARFSDKNPYYIILLRKWGDVSFRQEDYERYKPEDSKRDFDSLVEKTIKAVYHGAKRLSKAAVVRRTEEPADVYDPRDDLVWAERFVGAHYERFPDQEWFPYYYGKLLIWSGNRSEARDLIVDTVKRKSGEFWAWENLADTFSGDEVDYKIACLCRACMCRVQNPSYLVNVRMELAKLLISKGAYAEAKAEVEAVVRIREENKWKIPAEITTIKQQEWFQKAETRSNNEAFYRSKAADAERLLFDSSEWSDAVITGHLPQHEDRSAKFFLGYSTAAELKEVSFPENRFPSLAGLPRGTPVRIVVESRSGRDVVVVAEPRDGTPWDSIPPVVGMVTVVNEERGLTTVAVGKNAFCIFAHDRFTEVERFAPGDAASVRTRKDLRRDRLLPLTVEHSDASPSPQFARDFTGNLQILDDGRFGFVESIYIPAFLLAEARAGDGERVSGMAVCEWNNRKNEFTWRAVSLIKSFEE